MNSLIASTVPWVGGATPPGLLRARSQTRGSPKDGSMVAGDSSSTGGNGGAGGAGVIGAGAGTGSGAGMAAGGGVKRGPLVPIRRVRTTKAPAARVADPREAGRASSAPWGGSDGGGGGISSDDEMEEVTAPLGAPFSGSSPRRVAAAAAAEASSGGDGGGGCRSKKRRAADALAWSGDDEDGSPPFVGKGKGAAPGNRTDLAKPVAVAGGPPYSGRAGGGVGFNGISGGGLGESCGRQRRLQSPTGRSRLALPAAAARSPSGGGCSGGSASPSAFGGPWGGAGAGSGSGSGSSGAFGKPEGRRSNGLNVAVGVIDLTGDACPLSLTQRRAEEAGQRAQAQRLFAPVATVGVGRNGTGRAELTISNWPPTRHGSRAGGVGSGGGGSGSSTAEMTGSEPARDRGDCAPRSGGGAVALAGELSGGGTSAGAGSAGGENGSGFFQESGSKHAAAAATAAAAGVPEPGSSLGSGSDGRPGGVSAAAAASNATTSAAGKDGERLACTGNLEVLPPRPAATLQLRRPELSSSSSSCDGKGLGARTASMAAAGAAAPGGDGIGGGADGRDAGGEAAAAAVACLARLDLTVADVEAAGAAYPSAGGGARVDHRGCGGACGGGLANGGSGGGGGGARGVSEGKGDDKSDCGTGFKNGGAGIEANGQDWAGRGAAAADDASTTSSSAMSVTSVEDGEEDENDDDDYCYILSNDPYDPDFHSFDPSSEDSSSEEEQEEEEGGGGGGGENGMKMSPAAVKATLARQVAETKLGMAKGAVATKASNRASDLGHRDGDDGLANRGGPPDSGHPLLAAATGAPTKNGGRGRKRQQRGSKAARRAAVKLRGENNAAATAAGVDRKPSKPRARVVVEPLVPPQPPPGPRKWPARPANRAIVYAAAAQASRRSRGFTGWLFPKLPPPLPPPPPPLPPPVKTETEAEKEKAKTKEELEDGADRDGEASAAAAAAEEDDKDAIKKKKDKNRFKGTNEDGFLGFAKDNPPGAPSPNKFGWLRIHPCHTPEGRAALRRRALERKRRALEEAARRKRDELERRRVELERIAFQKRQEILDALRIKEEIAEARRKRHLNVLFLGMTRVAQYDAKGGLAKGMKRFEDVEKMLREDVNEANMNPLRDTARVLAMEALGHEVRCISKVSTPGESDSDKSRSTRAHGAPTGLGRFLATDITNTSASRGFLRRIEEKWDGVTFDTVLLDHYWLPDSVVWLNKGYMANDGGLIQNLVRMTTTRLLSEDFEIMLPINQAFFELLLPHFADLERHFTVEFLVGERLEHLKRSHLALEADDLIPEHIMQHVYGKEPERQVSRMLGVKQPTARVAAVLLKYGVAAEHFCYARFLKLSRNPPPHPALAAVALTAASESAKIAEDMAKVASESAQVAAESARALEEAGMSGSKRRPAAPAAAAPAAAAPAARGAGDGASSSSCSEGEREAEGQEEEESGDFSSSSSDVGDEGEEEDGDARSSAGSDCDSSSSSSSSSSGASSPTSVDVDVE
eukprot:g19775.t1